MKNQLLLSALLLVHGAQAGWQDLGILQENATRPHTTMMTYPDVASALSFERERSPWFQSLNGADWKFKWSDDIFLNLDHKQLGVGGNNSWWATALPKYQLLTKEASYSYRLLPLDPGQSIESRLNFKR